MIVLGIETSCDDTGVALYDASRGLRAHQLSSQVEIHAEYGGVVPELASRDHIRKTLPLVIRVLKDAGIRPADLAGVAYTAGPGLIGALLVGAALGRSLAYAWGCRPSGYTIWRGTCSPPCWARPAGLSLHGAAGLGRAHAARRRARHRRLPHPRRVAGRRRRRGLRQDRQAAGARLSRRTGDLAPGRNRSPGRFTFPRPMLDRPGLDFSFSGLKTAVSLAIDTARDEQTRADIARAFEEAVVDTLVAKCRRALQQTGHDQLVVAGGVSANRRLRAQLDRLSDELRVRMYFPRPEFCTDNGAMIAYAGYIRLRAGQTKRSASPPAHAGRSPIEEPRVHPAGSVN